MATVRLTESRQDALCALLALEPDSAKRLPDLRMLETLRRLIPFDVVVIVTSDTDGDLVDSVALPTWMGWLHGRPDGEWCPEGIVHEIEHPRLRRSLARTGMTDGLVLSFRDGPDRMVRLWLDRQRHRFSDGEVSLLRMVAPQVLRLLRERPATRLTPGLTLQERRVLDLVATGMTNAEVASRMSVAPSTVRKHLEHAFRKLGVSNRLAAVKAYEALLALPAPLEERETFA